MRTPSAGQQRQRPKADDLLRFEWSIRERQTVQIGSEVAWLALDNLTLAQIGESLRCAPVTATLQSINQVQERKLAFIADHAVQLWELRQDLCVAQAGL